MKKIAIFTLLTALGCLAHQLFAQSSEPELDHECTSWMVFADLTQNNTNILHKNRDSRYRDIAVFLSPANSPRKWVALGNNPSSNPAIDASANMAINSSGLAGVMNSGEKCIHKADDQSKKCTPAVMRAVIESCDTAAQAVEKLRSLLKAGDYCHGDKGSIFFFCDLKEGYVCELTAKELSVVRYDKGYTVRANIWINPGMQQLSRNFHKAYLNSANRMYVTISGLNAALDKGGKITLQDIFAVSRSHKLPADIADRRSVCYNNTNSAASLEIDREYPGVLSTAYVTIGHPLHTLYIPVPICTEKVLPAMNNKAWSKAAFDRFDKLGLQDIPAEWVKFERDSMNQYRSAQAKSRSFLKNGKRAEAVKLLNQTAHAIWQKAAELLQL